MFKDCMTVLLLLLPLASFSISASNQPRWYTQDQVNSGTKLFRQHCAGCHGQNAEATPNWKQIDSNGFYPPPPLNGTAHAWHHDLAVLREQVREGGLKIGGQMPAFEQVLTTEQIDQVIAFFQSQWPNELYVKWADNFAVKPALPSVDDLKKLVSSKPDLTYLRQRLGTTDIATPSATGIDKLYKIPFNEKTLYLSEDGEFAIIGEMIDLKKGINLNK